MPKNLLERLQSQTNAKIYNLYGPTETTVYSTFKDMSKTSIIKIGKPINNTQILILNEFPAGNSASAPILGKFIP